MMQPYVMPNGSLNANTPDGEGLGFFPIGAALAIAALRKRQRARRRFSRNYQTAVRRVGPVQNSGWSRRILNNMRNNMRQAAQATRYGGYQTAVRRVGPAQNSGWSRRILNNMRNNMRQAAQATRYGGYQTAVRRVGPAQGYRSAQAINLMDYF